MSDSDEDYMSDKLLMECEKDDVRPGLLYNTGQKRKHEMFKKQLELPKKQKSYHEQEKETRDKGLSTAISSDNKGFKLLEKMGYKTGTSLGKSSSGITEPIVIKPKDDTSGIGREKHCTDTLKKKQEIKEKTLQMKEEEFRVSNTERRNAVALQKDYRKAQRICEELDFKSEVRTPEIPFFWSKRTRDSLKQKTQNDDGEQHSSDEEPEEISEPKLCDMIVYLRRKYNYCMYCCDYVEERQNAVSMCPGYFRRDHDE